jgi:hypothetical protein
MQKIIEKQKFSILETLIITICICALIFASILGVFNQWKANEDKIRIRNAISLTKALEQYYNDSSSTEFSRKYPISQCSTTSPNSVDYEHTLYIALTGIQTNSFKYLESKDFPQDEKADYVDQIQNDCLGLLKDFNTSNYSKTNKRCDHRPANAKNFCYLYSTSPEGDRFTISLYSDTKNKRGEITKLRNNPIVTEGINLNSENFD